MPQKAGRTYTRILQVSAILAEKILGLSHSKGINEPALEESKQKERWPWFAHMNQNQQQKMQKPTKDNSSR